MKHPEIREVKVGYKRSRNRRPDESLSSWQRHRQALTAAYRKNPGASWRATGDPDFDELCVDDWFHLERMNKREWAGRIGNWLVCVTLPADPRRAPKVTFEHDRPVRKPVHRRKRP